MAIERARLCSRPGCAEPAAARLVFQYATRSVWVEELAEREPHAIDLCGMHADRTTPPMGWTAEDRRRSAGPGVRAAS